MKAIVRRGVAVAGLGVGAGALWRWRSRHAAVGDNGVAHRWLVVTVNRPPDEVVSDERLPEPLARLGDAIEVQASPAPGGRGTELAARLVDPAPSGPSAVAARLTGQDPRQAVRAALREAKSLIETGEVLRADEPPTTRATPGGKLLGLATRRAGGEGRL